MKVLAPSVSICNQAPVQRQPLTSHPRASFTKACVRGYTARVHTLADDPNTTQSRSLSLVTYCGSFRELERSWRRVREVVESEWRVSSESYCEVKRSTWRVSVVSGLTLDTTCWERINPHSTFWRSGQDLVSRHRVLQICSSFFLKLILVFFFQNYQRS